MSSNETINVQRSDLIRLQENIDPHRGAVAWGIVCNLLGMPSGHNQDKPVAGDLREAFDSLLDALQLAGHEKEFNKAIGRYKYNQPAFELFQRLAARADAGEIERLREAHTNLANLYGKQRLDLEQLQAQLAEGDALLTDISNRDWSGVDFDLPADLVARIKSLSASAEPPTATWLCPQCKLEQPTERPCDACGNATELNQTMESADRAIFERCILGVWPDAPINRKRDLLEKDDPDYGEYCDEPMRRAYQGWKACRALMVGLPAGDTGGIEQLRFDLAEMTKSHQALGSVYAGTQKGFERLQARLAEQMALVGWWKDHLAVHLAILFGTSGHSPEDADKSAEDIIRRAERLAPQVTQLEELTFAYVHSKTGERRTVTVTRSEVADKLDYLLFEKLSAAVCRCESVGETNAADCCCDEVAENFELVKASALQEKSS